MKPQDFDEWFELTHKRRWQLTDAERVRLAELVALRKKEDVQRVQAEETSAIIDFFIVKPIVFVFLVAAAFFVCRFLGWLFP